MMVSPADVFGHAPNEPKPTPPLAERLSKRLEHVRAELVRLVAEADDITELAALVADTDRDRDHPVTGTAGLLRGTDELHAARIRGLAQRLEIE